VTRGTRPACCPSVVANIRSWAIWMRWWRDMFAREVSVVMLDRLRLYRSLEEN